VKVIPTKKPKNSNVHSQSKDEDSSNSSSSSDSDSTGNSSSEDSSSDDSSDEKETNSSITSSGKSNMKILQTNKTSKLKIEESSSDSDSGTSSSSEESSSSQNDKKSLQVLPKNSLTPKTVSNTASTKNDSKRATIRVNSSTGNKIEVSLNNIRQKRSPWNRNGNNDSSRGQNTLLGNKNVGRWDDDEEDGNENLQNKKTTDLREALSKQMDKNDRRRKRGMYLNSWDAALDAGKKKKVKAKDLDENKDYFNSSKSNPFHRIQSSMQAMGKGRAKGHLGGSGYKPTFLRKDKKGGKTNSNFSKRRRSV